MKNYFKLTFLGILPNVTFARGCVVSFLMDLDLNLTYVNEIKTIVSEAVTNAVVHGYENREPGDVILEVYLEDDVMKIVVEDFGVGIEDVQKAREPLFTTKLQEDRAGLGFTIMDIFSDELDVKSTVGKGTKVLITKFLKFNKRDE